MLLKKQGSKCVSMMWQVMCECPYLTVVPRDSAWFGEYAPGAKPGDVVELRAQALYKEDWLGLKAWLATFTTSPFQLKCQRRLEVLS